MATHGNKIMIIDDSNSNVVLLEAILKIRGYNTITALNAKDAIPLIEKEKPNLILLDLYMPETSGFDLLSILKSDAVTKNIPVIIVSAVTDEVNILKTKALGATDYIKKPIDIQLLIEKVEEIIN